MSDSRTSTARIAALEEGYKNLGREIGGIRTDVQSIVRRELGNVGRIFDELAAGDVILSGTPSGVGPVVRGDVMELAADGLGTFTVTVV